MASTDFDWYLPVRANTAQIDGLSAHSGSNERMAWLGTPANAPDAASSSTASDDLGWNAAAGVGCHSVSVGGMTASA